MKTYGRARSANKAIVGSSSAPTASFDTTDEENRWSEGMTPGPRAMATAAAATNSKGSTTTSSRTTSSSSLSSSLSVLGDISVNQASSLDESRYGSSTRSDGVSSTASSATSNTFTKGRDKDSAKCSGKRSRCMQPAEVLNGGHHDDLTLLSEMIAKFNNPTAHFGVAGPLFVSVPDSFSENGRRYTAWLQQLGFEEGFLGPLWGFKYPREQVGHLDRLLRERRDKGGSKIRSDGSMFSSSGRDSPPHGPENWPSTMSRSAEYANSSIGHVMDVGQPLERKRSISDAPRPRGASGDAGAAGLGPGPSGFATVSRKAAMKAPKTEERGGGPAVAWARAASAGPAASAAASAAAAAAGFTTAGASWATFPLQLREGVLRVDSEDSTPRSESPAGFLDGNAPHLAFVSSPTAVRHRRFFPEAAGGLSGSLSLSGRSLPTVAEGVEEGIAALKGSGSCGTGASLDALEEDMDDCIQAQLGVNMTNLALDRSRANSVDSRRGATKSPTALALLGRPGQAGGQAAVTQQGHAHAHGEATAAQAAQAAQVAQAARAALEAQEAAARALEVENDGDESDASTILDTSSENGFAGNIAAAHNLDISPLLATGAADGPEAASQGAAAGAAGPGVLLTLPAQMLESPSQPSRLGPPMSSSSGALGSLLSVPGSGEFAAAPPTGAGSDELRVHGRGRLPPDDGAARDAHDREHGRDPLSRRTLRRCMSAPLQPSASGLQTPGGFSLPQNDAAAAAAAGCKGEYRTPQSNRCPLKPSGAVRERDWGVSKPASTTPCTRLQPELFDNVKRAADGKPPISRSHSAMGYIETAVFHGGGAAAGHGHAAGAGLSGPVNLIGSATLLPSPGQGQGIDLSRPVAQYGPGTGVAAAARDVPVVPQHQARPPSGFLNRPASEFSAFGLAPRHDRNGSFSSIDTAAGPPRGSVAARSGSMTTIGSASSDPDPSTSPYHSQEDLSKLSLNEEHVTNARRMLQEAIRAKEIKEGSPARGQPGLGLRPVSSSDSLASAMAHPLMRENPVSAAPSPTEANAHAHANARKMRDKRRAKNSAAKDRRMSVSLSASKGHAGRAGTAVASAAGAADDVDALADMFGAATALSPSVLAKAGSSTARRAAAAARSRQFAAFCLQSGQAAAPGMGEGASLTDARLGHLELLCGTDEDRRQSMAVDDVSPPAPRGAPLPVQVGTAASASASASASAGRFEGWFVTSEDAADVADAEAPGAGERHASDSHRQADNSALTEMTFKGPVIGGTYQHCFEGPAPLVAPPTAADKRVVGTHLSADGDALELSLYLPKDDSTTTINLGTGWRWVPAAPVGYVVSKGPIVPRKKLVCYYVPRHPVEWAREAAADMAAAAGCEMDLARPAAGAGAGGDGTGMESAGRSPEAAGVGSLPMDCDGHDICASEPQVSPGAAVHGDRHAHAMAVESPSSAQPEPFTGRGDTATAASATDADAELRVLQTPTADWNCPHVVTYVLQYLLGDEAQALARGRGSGAGEQKGGRRGRGKRTADPAAQQEDATSYRLVSKAWALGSYRLLARHLSRAENCPALDYQEWSSFVRRNAYGKFLSQGACKDVYCVQPVPRALADAPCLDAISVMDVADLDARGMGDAVAQELEVSLLCSSLVSLRICPNLVQVKSIFRSEYPAPETFWRADAFRPPLLSRNGNGNGSGSGNGALGAELFAVDVPKKGSLDRGSHQYIRMEFCAGGDLEDVVRRAGQLAVPDVRALFFQMCYALYACREKLALRHFDVKLLNFFVTNGAALLPPAHQHRARQHAAEVHLHVGFGEHVFAVPLSGPGLSVVKLADFGTSAVGGAALGDPIGAPQFTTLENTPPEFLICGSAARQAFSADTFPLGLSAFHLLTGQEPYEELLAGVRCPAYLKQELRRYWETDDMDSPYYVVGETMRSLDPGDDEEGSDDEAQAGERAEPGDVLYHTLYRYLVLFAPEDDGGDDATAVGGARFSRLYDGVPLWGAMLDAVGLLPLPAGGGALAPRRGKRKPSERDRALRDASVRQFAADRGQWSLHVGAHPVAASARARLQALGGDAARRLFDRLVHFDPARRCTMHEALLSPVFACYRQPHSGLHGPRAGAGPGEGVVAFMHYHRPRALAFAAAGGASTLPMV